MLSTLRAPLLRLSGYPSRSKLQYLPSLRNTASSAQLKNDTKTDVENIAVEIPVPPTKDINNLIRVAIVGRPNTGKSTLFNRLTRSNLAIVSDIPGTTRDRKEGYGVLSGLPMTVIDTGGLDDRGAISLDIKGQVEVALHSADVILFMLDAKVGVNTVDEYFGNWLRKKLGEIKNANNKKASDKDSNKINSKSNFSDSTSNNTNQTRIPLMQEVVVLANKTEGAYMSDRVLDSLADACRLGLGDPMPISASHGDGLTDLAQVLIEAARRRNLQEALPDVEQVDKSTPIAIEDRRIQLAIMGRPNVGKSSLLNAMLGGTEERVITGPTPGLTRDSIHVDWVFNDRMFRLVDTAGLTRTRLLPSNGSRIIKKSGAEKKLESKVASVGKAELHAHARSEKKMARALPGIELLDPERDPSQFSLQVSELALASALNALKFAQVVLVVIEGSQHKFTNVDLQLARKCLEEGRALIIVANKRDEVALMGISGAEYEQSVRKHCDAFIRNFGEIRVISTSAKPNANEGIKRLLSNVIDIHDAWSRRISTWVLNRWVKDLMVTAPTPRSGGKAIHVKYMTQVKTRPPTFALFCNAEELPGFFETFLRSKLQRDFQLEGVPIRFNVRRSIGSDVVKKSLRHTKATTKGRGRNFARSVSPTKRASPYLKMKNKNKRLEIRKKFKRMRSRQGHT